MNYKLHICSENDFPTAAGLASSAAGYACFVYTLASLYGLENEELTAIARLGSGSACRSIYGGFVQWHKGELADGTDSIATQIAPASHWPEMHVLILVVSDARKKVGSTVGMRLSIENSELLKYRASQCVSKHTKEMTEAILNKDFAKFGELTMRESNQFHAICLDTYPPCVYMNDQSHNVSSFIHKYNEVAGGVRVSFFLSSVVYMNKIIDFLFLGCLHFRCRSKCLRLFVRERSQQIFVLPQYVLPK